MAGKTEIKVRFVEPRLPEETDLAILKARSGTELNSETRYRAMRELAMLSSRLRSRQ